MAESGTKIMRNQHIFLYIMNLNLGILSVLKKENLLSELHTVASK